MNLLVVTFLLTAAQLEKRDHDVRCQTACIKTPGHSGGSSYQTKKNKWMCRCTTDYEESDLCAAPFTAVYTSGGSSDRPPPIDDGY